MADSTVDYYSNRKRLRETETELLLSKAHASKLEIELAGLKRDEKLRKVEESQKKDDSYQNLVDRVHKLEVERKELLVQLKDTKDDLSTVKCKLYMKSKAFDDHHTLTASQLRDLEAKVIEMEERASSAELERNFLREHSQQLVEKHEIEVSCLKALCEGHERSIAHLKERNSELEGRVHSVLSQETELETLKKSLSLAEDDARLVNSMKDTITKYSELEAMNRRLVEENKILAQTCGNSDLLKYKVASLEEKLKKSDILKGELAKLEIEHESLKSKLSKWEVSEDSTLPSSPLTMARRLAELQQSELLLRNQLGQKETELKVSMKQLSDADGRSRELVVQLASSHEEVKAKDEQIKRMERKLVFVTKERDGLSNVLSTYKLDAGVDQQLKNLLVETEKRLERSHERIQDLEKQLQASVEELTTQAIKNAEASVPVGISEKSAVNEPDST